LSESEAAPLREYAHSKHLKDKTPAGARYFIAKDALEGEDISLRGGLECL
jgi:hypothetical protein